MLPNTTLVPSVGKFAVKLAITALDTPTFILAVLVVPVTTNCDTLRESIDVVPVIVRDENDANPLTLRVEATVSEL